MTTPEPQAPTHFIRNRIRKELEAGQCQQVITRFPPEPNGYLHLGHAKSIALNFSMGEEFGGYTNLRFDDTNPAKEEQRYIDAIKEDVQWLGYAWKHERHASDYFEQLYEWALYLIDHGLAYVDSQDADTIRQQRGTLTEPGIESPFRDRPREESRDLFERMRAGEFQDGAHVLRARIDMASGNINLRDPVIYRIRRLTHPRTGDQWCIYPSYDFAHGQSDAIEHITHSLCTLEFEDHRPLYDWLLEHLPVPSRPVQIEFSRLNLDFTVLSKRRLTRLVDEGHVHGWDDPRLPTLAGIRRRGFTPQSIRQFCQEIGVTKADSIIPFGVLENALRNDLNERAPRTMAVLKPLKLVLTNFPEGETEWLESAVHPQKPEMGTRKVAMTREIYIEADDFMEEAPKKFFRLKPGGEVRLRNAFIIRCDEVIKDESGQVVELRCSLDPETRSGQPGADRKVKGTIHWVSAAHSVSAQVRLYDRLFQVPHPAGDKDKDFIEHINPESLVILENARLEPAAAKAAPGECFQFERLGYFVPDPDGTLERPVFNRAVTLRDTWAKLEKQMRG
ncbi:MULTISPECIES: glutamine--tRNA ligase/YqeY domain fusion protein [Ectothiorhodospira]|uniref:glutamine--tRNA ligase/YqeY domain fusion protein n=1 Tax=Ectothiorhodospira TaxID=1051 RepID=UPI001EE85748|nr:MULTISPECIES: glutamine--tRNA ligase/YqeY domain fusion protein [Ectothiorhodospira]MCG5495082.1 glutamine--tRNA ligase/YqeY domain fusion protein [Ectothiorhodospira variabilis]MCG5498623.1 glutamine--tRNA ligase/YqeY domain fusion protein [Ectothiorhodospira variabilis]MCG5504669.1 glutamine--tRNA ligase/YqeY domain fusion protein [Ectothiorhodospira variabilis]MCG5507778.1 glutamine--tRNA ligase/YqeY domain fusion protein [Ectothiorhodospira variabilis]MCG5525702.1 glutamine--tRNA ligase